MSALGGGNIENFEDYAGIYDSFYLEKNYKLETLNLMKLVNRFRERVSRVLEIGAGTGSYSQEIARHGISVKGIDKSISMIKIAKQRNAFPRTVEYLGESLTDYALKKDSSEKFDAVFALFHVVTYFNDNELVEFVKLCDEVLEKDGLVVFDFWEKNAVAARPPIQGIKFGSIGKRVVKRVCLPTFKSSLDEVLINFQFEEDGQLIFTENHYMYPRTTEKLLEVFMRAFEFCGSFDLTTGRKFNLESYGCLIIFRKV